MNLFGGSSESHSPNNPAFGKSGWIPNSRLKGEWQHVEPLVYGRRMYFMEIIRGMMNWIRYCGSKPADLKIFHESLGGRCDGCNIVATACMTCGVK